MHTCISYNCKHRYMHASWATIAVDGMQLFYEREVPLELRSAVSIDNPSEVGQALRASVRE